MRKLQSQTHRNARLPALLFALAVAWLPPAALAQRTPDFAAYAVPSMARWW